MSNNKIFKKILIGEIPKSIRQEVSDHIRHYSVVLLISNNDDNKVIPCAGTLCQIGKHYGIITAGHVWKEIKDSKELIIPFGFRGGQISLEPGYLEAYCPFIQVDRNGIEKPDIAFIYLPENKASNIQAFGKVFYSIDKRINNQDYDRDLGYWVSFGAPNELLEPGRAPSLTYSTDLKRKYEIDTWDYLELVIDFKSEPRMPKSLEGMSGGGIWNVRIFTDTEDENKIGLHLIKDVLFSGVNFYQSAIENNHRMILGHGPKSLYINLFKNIT